MLHSIHCHGSRGSRVNWLMGHVGHGSKSVTHCHLWLEEDDFFDIVSCFALHYGMHIVCHNGECKSSVYAVITVSEKTLNAMSVPCMYTYASCLLAVSGCSTHRATLHARLWHKGRKFCTGVYVRCLHGAVGTAHVRLATRGIYDCCRSTVHFFVWFMMQSRLLTHGVLLLMKWVVVVVSSCLTAHQHNTRYSVPLTVERWKDLY